VAKQDRRNSKHSTLNGDVKYFVDGYCKLADGIWVHHYTPDGATDVGGSVDYSDWCD